MPNNTLEKWDEKTLVELCNIEIGKTPSRSNIKFWDKTRSTNNTWLSIADLNNTQNKKVFSSKEQISDLATQYMKLVKEGTLLLSFKLTIGRVAFAGKDLYTNEAIAQLPIKNEQKIDKHYLYYYLQYFDYEELLKGDVKVKGKTLNKEKLKGLPVCYPPLPEQERIVAKLDKAFEAIDKVKANAEKNLNNAKELFETALNNAFTENTDGWEEKTLGEVSQIISGTTPDTSNPDFWGKGNYWVTPAEINEDNLYIRKTDREITNLAIESCSLRKMPRGTIIFSSRAPIGKIAISDVDTLYCNQGFKNFICSKNIYNKFLYYFLLKNKKYIISLGKGTTFKEVSKGIISAVNIQYPSLPEQHKIVEKLDKLQEQTKQLEAIYTKKIKDLDELKQSILQKAFRGEL